MRIVRPDYSLLVIRIPVATLAIAVSVMAPLAAGEAELADGRLAVDVLTEAQWQEVDDSVDRGLAWIASQQDADGSFHSNRRSGQPGITSLCLMAFLSRGHLPGEGDYGEQLSRAVDFVLSCQQDGGLLCQDPPEPAWLMRMPSHTSSYNHSITGVMLGEVYGMAPAAANRRLGLVIKRALEWSRQLQTNYKAREIDRGGFRYLEHNPRDVQIRSDLSATAWHLMFYRSAKNAGFDVPQEFVDDATAYARRCHVPADDQNRRLGAFSYTASQTFRSNYAMTGCGIVTLVLAGNHRDPLALDGGRWLMERPITRYDGVARFAYASYYASQAMAQLGGEYWKSYYPPLAQAIIEGQRNDGSWISRHDTTRDFGRCYPSSMAILALTPAYQLLPIYQR